MMSPSSPHDVTDEAILAEEEAAQYPAQQLDESSPPPPANVAEEEERLPAASPPEPEPGGGRPPAPTKEADEPTARRSRAISTPSVSSAGGTAFPGGVKRGRRGGGRGDAPAATATARPPPDDDGDDDDDDDDDDDPPDAAAVASASSSPIPFSADEYPQLEIDDSVDHAGLATAFRRPLFGGASAARCSRPLTIAYSHLADAARLRRRAVRRRNATLAEYEALRTRFLKKKVELSVAEGELGEHDRKTGAWTRKVFDLELEEPCEWREGYERLRRYREERGRLPPTSVKKARDEEERSVSDWLCKM